MSDRSSYNYVLLVGYVSNDPNFKKVRNEQTSMCRFDIATNEAFRNRKTDNVDSHTEFHRIVTWGKRAEFCSKWLKKGRLLTITGKLRHRTYKDNDGIKRRITEVNADEIILLGKKEDFEEEIQEDPLKTEQEREPGEDDNNVPF